MAACPPHPCLHAGPSSQAGPTWVPAGRIQRRWPGGRPSRARLCVRLRRQHRLSPHVGEMQPPHCRGALQARVGTGHPPMTSAASPVLPQAQAGRPPPARSLCCVPTACQALSWELQPQDQMWALPPGTPSWVWTGEAVMALWPINFCPHQPCPGEGLGPRWATWVPGPREGAGWSGAALSGSWPGAAVPRRVPPPAASPRALLSACPQVTWSLFNVQEAYGPSPEPRALIYVLLLGSIFSKNRMDVRKTTMPQNHT